ncbi:hypothetical protein MTER_20630 [Mycolicibacter terrae]|uniref:NmrA-like domain-containing protein n=1 Tax=Mycolicibacter terrae TaxID=1788 RepID=A0AAD1HW63_9MYCO|nr:hypothetical protein MTER_20630 [Mycolicibacter terrae]SNV73218.1 NmrA-like family protein [Mycolicibacter terrae]
MTSKQPSHRGEVLVIGAGELGGAVVAALSQRDDAPAVTVLLRPSDTPRHAQLRNEIMARGAGIAEADVATATVAELATMLAQFHTVVSCIGFAAGSGTQRKITEAALAAGVPRYLPWQFGATTTRSDAAVPKTCSTNNSTFATCYAPRAPPNG